MVFVLVLYNSTSLVHTEFRTYFSRMFSLISCSNHYTKPDEINRIGEEVIKKYFPTGEINDNSHLDAVKVMYLIISNEIVYSSSLYYIYY